MMNFPTNIKLTTETDSIIYKEVWTVICENVSFEKHITKKELLNILENKLKIRLFSNDRYERVFDSLVLSSPSLKISDFPKGFSISLPLDLKILRVKTQDEINSEYENRIKKMKKISRNENNKGIYFLYDADDELIYIGQSSDIRQRLSQHNNKAWLYYKIIIINGYKERLDMEKRLIRYFKPEYNLNGNGNYK